MALSFAAMLGAGGMYFMNHPALTVSMTERSSPESMQETPSGTPSRAAFEAHLTALMQQLQKEPNNVPVMVSIAEHFLDDNEYAMAENFAGRALAIQPDNPDALYFRGLARHNQGKNNEAAKDFEASLAKRDDPTIRYSLGILYAYFIKDTARGISELKKTLAMPGLPEDLAELTRSEIAKLSAPPSSQKQN